MHFLRLPPFICSSLSSLCSLTLSFAATAFLVQPELMDMSDQIGNHTSSNASDHIQLLETSNLKLSALICIILNILLTIIGLFGNSFSIYIFSKRSQLHRNSTIQLICLSVVDLALLLCFIPLLIAPQLAFIQDSDVPKTLIDVINYSFVFLYPWAVTFQTISVMLLVLITAERFLAVCYPIKVNRLHSIMI